MQPTDKRKTVRRAVTYPAFLDFGDGSPARRCTLCDASQEGALLAVADPRSVPDEFILALSSVGAARRRCRVVWRSEREVGVEFLKDHRAAAVAQSAEVSAEPAAERVDIDTLTPR